MSYRNTLTSHYMFVIIVIDAGLSPEVKEADRISLFSFFAHREVCLTMQKGTSVQ